MSDDHPHLDDEAIDRLGRAAGAEMRRPAPEAGAEQIAASARRRRATRKALVGGAAVAALVGVGAVIVLARRSGESVHTAPSIPSVATTDPAPTRPATTVATVAPTTAPPSTVAPTSSPPASSPPTSTTPTTAPPRTWDGVAELVDVPWESAGIPRACGEVWWEQQQLTQTRCTSIAIDPSGVPITYDPANRVVTRHTRSGGPVSFVLPDEYIDPNLIAAGPGDVAYFALDNEWPKSSDVIAVSVSPDDPGAVLERFPEAMGIVDADVFATPTGLVLSGWRDQGLRPAPDAAPFVEWVRRDGARPDERSFPLASFNDAEGLVDAGGWQWQLGDRLVIPDEPGTARVIATYDGGFIALYTEHTGDLRAEVMRGYRDGTVEHWLLPTSWSEVGTPVLEPQGTVLVPNGDVFVRVSPFEPRSNGWDGRLEIDATTGTAEAIGLNEFIDSYVASLDDSGDATLPWNLGPIAFGDALAGRLAPSELRTITGRPADGGDYIVTVTSEGLLDDSSFGSRLTITLVFDEWFRVGDIGWAQACQPGRGHQDYQPASCA